VGHAKYIKRDRKRTKSGVLKIDGTKKGAESSSRDYVCARACPADGIDRGVAVSLKCSLAADGGRRRKFKTRDIDATFSGV